MPSNTTLELQQPACVLAGRLNAAQADVAQEVQRLKLLDEPQEWAA
jgi:hypothetical protein